MSGGGAVGAGVVSLEGAAAGGAGALVGDRGLSGEPVEDGGRAAISAQLVSGARGWRACAWGTRVGDGRGSVEGADRSKRR